MQWIKASERLPSKFGKYWIRRQHNGREVKTGSHFDGFKFPHYKSEIEWLDESPTPLSSGAGEMEGYTPGEWKVTAGVHSHTKGMCVKGQAWFNVNSSDGGVIADVLYGGCLGNDEKEAEANARLIAAAPSLLEENKRLREALEEIHKLANPKNTFINNYQMFEIATKALNK